MFRTFARRFLPNPFDRMLRRLAKRGGRKILLCWNRGLGDIALGLYAMVERARELVPGAEITFLTRENLREGFSLLKGVEVMIAPGLKRGDKVCVKELGVSTADFDLIIESPSPTDWVAWQRGRIVPKLEWKDEELWRSYGLSEEDLYIGVQPVAETQYGLWRNWPCERWMELFTYLERLKGVKVLLFGFGNAPHFPQSNVIDLRGKTSLFQLLSLIKNRCRALIAPDSGVLSMVYYLNASFPIDLISLWADPNHGILKQNVASPNPKLRHIPMVGEHRDLATLPAAKLLNALFPLKPLRSVVREEAVALLPAPKVGVIILAGGEGSRLGQAGPKGLFPILGKSLFQILCEKVPEEVPIAIMTSPLNHEETVAFFEKKRLFGRQIQFFQQPMLPLLDEKKREVPLLAPDGNGSVFAACCAAFQESGVEAISIVPIENPLADPLDAKLLSHFCRTGADVVVKCIEESEADATMGALVERERGGVEIVEYSELNPQETYSYRYTGMALFRFAFFQKAARQKIPYHYSWKKRGERFFWKREKFLFDLFPFADKVEALVYPRQKIYAPLKSLQNLEAVAKLLCPEKPMILRPIASGGDAATLHSIRSAPSGPAEENGCNGPQKGDFNGQMSFAIASLPQIEKILLS